MEYKRFNFLIICGTGWFVPNLVFLIGKMSVHENSQRMDKTTHTKTLKKKKKMDFVKKFGSSFLMINPNQLYDYLVNNNRNPSRRKMVSRVSVLLFGVKKSNILEKSYQKINY